MFDTIFSPLQQLKQASRSQIRIKRDDLIDPYISGNKWRKLKYILQEAKRQQKTHLITFGGSYSNHLVATAAACARAGLQSSAFVRGEEVDNEMLMLCKLYGMELKFTERASYKDKQFLFKMHYGNDHNAFFVDEGGASLEGTIGCSEIIAELPLDTDHIFCAAGTGTTAAGLLKGIQERGLKTQLHVVPVLKGGTFIADEIALYTQDLSALHLHTDYHFGGYAKTSPELIRYIQTFTAEEGVLLDPVYTGKMFFALEDLLRSGAFAKTERIVALHTGGLLGLLGMKDKFKAHTPH